MAPVLRACFGIAIWLCLDRALLADVVISEIMSRNVTTLADEDGDFSDWVELFNDSDTPRSLTGWHLSDTPLNPFRWTFPEIEIPAHGFLTVFCSGKDRRNPASPLHTNFALSGEGENVALTGADGRVQWQVQFPALPPDVSFGLLLAEERTLLPLGAEGRVIVPAAALAGDRWVEPGYDDSLWRTGAGGFGFDEKSTPTYSDFIETDLAAEMRDRNASAFFRFAFTLTGSPPEFLLLKMRFDDGFVAYVNGAEIARKNAPENLDWDSRSFGSQPVSRAREIESFKFKSAPELSPGGENVLAIHGLNDSPTNADFLVQPALDGFYLKDRWENRPRYFDRPLPGLPNAGGFERVSDAPEISTPAGVSFDPIAVEIRATSPLATVRYTLDGSRPTIASPIYEEPIDIARSAIVRARAFEPGELPSKIVEGVYVLLDRARRDVDSNLPLLVLDAGEQPDDFDFDEIFRPALGSVFDVTENGRTTLREPDAVFQCALKVRGQSSRRFNKKSFSLETRDAEGAARDLSFFGFPADSDWILHGPADFDRSLMRNLLAHGWSRALGRYAVRTVPIELYVQGSASAGDLWSDYRGVYILMEKIKRAPGRVDIAALGTSEFGEASLSGGYIFKFDWLGPGETGFSSGRFAFVDPKEAELSDRQKEWIEDYVESFESELERTDRGEPQGDLAELADLSSFVDYLVILELCRPFDGMASSVYMTKERSAPLEMGPVWDFNQSMGIGEGPLGWSHEKGLDWYRHLLADREFEEAYIARWEELRRTVLSDASIDSEVEKWSARLGEAAARDGDRWPSPPSELGYDAEVGRLKAWLARRIDWLDRELTSNPEFDPPAGQVARGAEVQIRSSAREVYFTTDGSDPRRSDDLPSASARAYEGPIPISENVMIRCRSRFAGGTWSDLVEAAYYLDLPTLALSEVLFRPLEGRDHEFVEIHNHGDASVDLVGVQLRGGIQFEFQDAALEPDAYAVIVSDRERFTERHGGDGIAILGEYEGFLSDGGEILELRGARGEPIVRFRYDSRWYSSTADGGHSLVLRDAKGSADREDWGDRKSWAPSAEEGGSPGRRDRALTESGGQRFGDANQDGRFNISDEVLILRLLFGLTPRRLVCGSGELDDPSSLRLLDATGDGTIDQADVVYGLRFLFLGGPSPAGFDGCEPILGCPERCSR